MVSAAVTIQNERGIHVRPSTIIANAIRAFRGEVLLETADGVRHAAASPMDVLALGLRPSETVRIHVSGPDEAAFAQELSRLLSRHYDFSEEPT